MNKQQETNEEFARRIVAEQKAAEQARIDAALAEFDRTTGAQAAERRAEAERAQQAAAEQAEADRQAKAKTEFDARHKAPALRAWVAQGGDAAEFERCWPEQAAKIRMREATRQNDEARAAFARMIRDW